MLIERESEGIVEVYHGHMVFTAVIIRTMLVLVKACGHMLATS